MSSPRFHAANFGSKLSIPPGCGRCADLGERACLESCAVWRREAQRARKRRRKPVELARLRSTSFVQAFWTRGSLFEDHSDEVVVRADAVRGFEASSCSAWGRSSSGWKINMRPCGASWASSCSIRSRIRENIANLSAGHRSPLSGVGFFGYATSGRIVQGGS
jgi:hypothetical protein